MKLTFEGPLDQALERITTMVRLLEGTQVAVGGRKLAGTEDVVLEIEIESTKNKLELEFEIKWRPEGSSGDEDEDEDEDEEDEESPAVHEASEMTASDEGMPETPPSPEVQSEGSGFSSTF